MLVLAGRVAPHPLATAPLPYTYCSSWASGPAPPQGNHKGPHIPSPPPLSLTFVVAGRVAPRLPRATTRVPTSPRYHPCPYNDSEPPRGYRKGRRGGAFKYGFLGKA